MNNQLNLKTSAHVVLINPYDEKWQYSASQNIVLRTVYTVLHSHGIMTSIIDADIEKLSPEICQQLLIAQKPQFIVIDFLFRKLPFIRSLVGLISHSSDLQECTLIVYGHSVSNHIHELMQEFNSLDVLVLNRPEITINVLIEKMIDKKEWAEVPAIAFRRDGLKINNYISHVGMPEGVFADRFYLSFIEKQKSIEMSTSIGCGYRCTFCNCSDNYFPERTQWIARSAEDVFNEVEYLVRKHDRRCFQFVDHNFLGVSEYGKQRARDIADKIIESDEKIQFSFFCRLDAIEYELFSKLKQAGLCCIHVGIESLSQRLLNRFNKNISVSQIIKATKIVQKLDIKFNPSFILFEPTATLEEIESTLDFIEEYGLYLSLSATSLIPVPETQMYEMLSANNLIDKSNEIVPGYIPNVKYFDNHIVYLKNDWIMFQKEVEKAFPHLIKWVNYYIDLYFNEFQMKINPKTMQKIWCYKKIELQMLKHCICNTDQIHGDYLIRFFEDNRKGLEKIWLYMKNCI